MNIPIFSLFTHRFSRRPNKETPLELEIWVSKGSQLGFLFETDGLRLNGNGNFKHNVRIFTKFPELLDREKEDARRAARLAKGVPKYDNQLKYGIFEQWRGPRIRIHSVKIEGPYYKEWPNSYQKRLIGDDLDPQRMPDVLKSIAAKAYRRSLKAGEMDDIIDFYHQRVEEVGKREGLIDALVVLFCTPSFLYINQADNSSQHNLATRMSYTLWSAAPDDRLKESVENKNLDELKVLNEHIVRMVNDDKSASFRSNFPNAWFELNQLGFMPPDPNINKFFSRKGLVEDMRRCLIPILKRKREL